MNQILREKPEFDRATSANPRPGRARRHNGRNAGLIVAALAVLVAGGLYLRQSGAARNAPPAPPPPQVTVARPLHETVAVSTNFLGQFSAVDKVELRAQVGGVLTSIDFRDGQVVKKGDLLFTIDPRPYQAKLQQAAANLQTAMAHKVLTSVELWRAQQLKRNDYGSMETVDQRAADDRSAAAAIDLAKAALTDAQLDLEYARITAPFTGRIGAHQVSIGNLVSGSRGGTSPTTLLATLVSLDPIYLDFDMSESDYITFQHAHPGTPKADVLISRNGEGKFDRHGIVDFVDNSINRDSGTIHLRATVPNPDYALTPGAFARLELPLEDPAASLLVPASAIVPDQSQNVVMVVGQDGKVVPHLVQTGPLYKGLRVIRSGLSPDDRVIIDGLMLVRPGAQVTVQDGTIKPDGT